MCCQPLSLIAAAAAGENSQQSEYRQVGFVKASGEEKKKSCGFVHVPFFLNEVFKSKPK